MCVGLSKKENKIIKKVTGKKMSDQKLKEITTK